MPATVALHATVAVPEPVTLVGEMAPQVKPAGTVSVRDTEPAKPFRPATVIVEVADVPTVTAAGEDAATVKSWNVKVTVVELVTVPLVAVTVATEVTA